MNPLIKKFFFWLAIFLISVFLVFLFSALLAEWQIGKIFSLKTELKTPPKIAKNEPPEVFNLTAKIMDIEEKSILVLDYQDETYKINIDEKTIINPSFKELKIGDYLTIEAKENIKNKKEFLASYINKIAR